MGDVAPRSWKESSLASNHAWSSLEDAKRTEVVAEVEPDEDWCKRFLPHHWSSKRGVGLQKRKPAHFTPLRGSQNKRPWALGRLAAHDHAAIREEAPRAEPLSQAASVQDGDTAVRLRPPLIETLNRSHPDQSPHPGHSRQKPPCRADRCVPDHSADPPSVDARCRALSTTDGGGRRLFRLPLTLDAETRRSPSEGRTLLGPPGATTH
jgi:hypothetical protein